MVGSSCIIWSMHLEKTKQSVISTKLGMKLGRRKSNKMTILINQARHFNKPNDWGFLLALHQTPLSDINFESFLYSTDSNQFAFRRGVLIALMIPGRFLRLAKEKYGIRNCCIHHSVCGINPWPFYKTIQELISHEGKKDLTLWSSSLKVTIANTE